MKSDCVVSWYSSTNKISIDNGPESPPNSLGEILEDPEGTKDETATTIPETQDEIDIVINTELPANDIASETTEVAGEDFSVGSSDEYIPDTDDELFDNYIAEHPSFLQRDLQDLQGIPEDEIDIENNNQNDNQLNESGLTRKKKVHFNCNII